MAEEKPYGQPQNVHIEKNTLYWTASDSAHQYVIRVVGNAITREAIQINPVKGPGNLYSGTFELSTLNLPVGEYSVTVKIMRYETPDADWDAVSYPIAYTVIPYEVVSNLYTIQSGTVPTTATLPEKCMAFGKVGGIPRLYGNSDGSISEVGQSAVIPCTTATAAATAAKVVTITGYTLKAGDIFALTYTNGNSAESVTINVNGTGAKSISIGGGVPTAVSGTGAHYVAANGVVLYYYDGTKFCLFGSQDITDADTTSIYNIYGAGSSAFVVSPSTAFSGTATHYAFIGRCEDGTIDKVSRTLSGTTGSGVRIFTALKISLFDNIFYASGTTTDYTANTPFALPLFSRVNVATADWKYSIGQYYNKSGVLTANTVTTDLVQTSLYVGGTRDGNYFIPSEYALTTRDTSKVYKRIGYFTTAGYLYFTDYQDVFAYVNGTWTTLHRDVYTKPEVDALVTVSSIPDATTTVKGKALLGAAGGAARYGQKADVGLDQVANLSPVNLPISNATQIALNTKQAVLTAGANINIAGNVISASAMVADIPDTVIKSSDNSVSELLVEGAGGRKLTLVVSETESSGTIDPLYMRSVYDVVISTQAGFEELIASPNWLGARSVALVGDGGTLRFTRELSSNITIPPTVFRIDGFNNAIIKFPTSSYDLRYAVKPSLMCYSISNLTIISGGFYRCINLTNCSVGISTTERGRSFSESDYLINCIVYASVPAPARANGFYNCNYLANCSVPYSDSFGGAYGFSSCTHLVNCTGRGSLGDVAEGYDFYNCSYLSNCRALQYGYGGTNLYKDDQSCS